MLGAASQCKHDRFFLFIIKGKTDKKWWDPQEQSRGKYGLPAVVEICKNEFKRHHLYDFNELKLISLLLHYNIKLLSSYNLILFESLFNLI